MKEFNIITNIQYYQNSFNDIEDRIQFGLDINKFIEKSQVSA